MAGTMLVAIAFSLGLFLALPLLITNLLGAQLRRVGKNSILFNLTDGVLRVALFLGYVSGISFMKDIRRVFEYHGAEHKAIAAYEAGVELTVENARPYSRIHPRCGTSFLIAVIALSILLFSLIPGAWPLWAKGLSRIVLLPADRRTGIRIHQVQREKMRESAHQEIDACRGSGSSASRRGNRRTIKLRSPSGR